MNAIGQKGFYKRELDFIEINASKYSYDFNEGLSTGKLIKKGGAL